MIHLEKPNYFMPRFEIVSCFAEHNGKFVLLHRQDHKSEGNTWGVIAGKIENGEDVADAIIRETMEETKIALLPDSLNYFDKVYVRYPDYDFTYYIFHTDLDVEPTVTINPNEHKAYRLASPIEALSMNLIGGLDECIRLFYRI